MNSEIQVPLNPHVWRKFQQAQTNFLKSLNMTRLKKEALHGRCWNGNQRPKKGFRRVKYWSRTMLRLTDRLFDES